MANTQKPFLYNDDFMCYMAQVNTPAPTMTDVLGGPIVVNTSQDGHTPNPVGSATWRRIGRNGARQYGEAGLTIDPAMETNKVKMVGSTAAQDVRLSGTEKTMMLRLADFQLQTVAAMWNFDTVEFASSGTSRAAIMEMALPSYRNEAAIAVVGQQNLWAGTPGRMVFWMPRAVVSNIGSFDLTKPDAAEIEVTFDALEQEVSLNVWTDMRIYQQIIA